MDKSDSTGSVAANAAVSYLLCTAGLLLPLLLILSADLTVK